MASTGRIVRNTVSLSSAYVGQKLLSFIYFTLIARLVGVLDTGVYVFALSYSTLWSVMVDFGLSNLLQREIAQKPEETKKLVSATLLLKMVYGFLAVVAGMTVLQFLNQPPQTVNMVAIAMAVMLFDSLNLTIWSAFRGHHKLQYESVSIVASQCIVLVVGLVGLHFDAQLEVLIAALLAGSVFTSIVAVILCRRHLGFWPLPSYQPFPFRRLFRESFSFGLAGAFTRVFASIDSVLLGQMVSKAAVGFYAVPNKVVFSAQFIPAAFSAAIYPAMSHYYLRDKEKMVAIFRQALLFLFLIAMPMTVGLYVLTPVVVRELYTGAYDPSIPAMRILVWGIIFGFLEFPLGALLAATGQQTKNSITRAIVMTVNVVLNILLIPRYSFFGTSIAALVSYIVLAGMGFYWTFPYWRDARDLFTSGVKIILSAFLMGLGVYFIMPFIHFSLAIVFGMIVYALLILLLRVVTLEQAKLLLTRFRRGSDEEVQSL
jgi:O-antigen/teichoic acid export membrane protein